MILGFAFSFSHFHITFIKLNARSRCAKTHNIPNKREITIKYSVTINNWKRNKKTDRKQRSEKKRNKTKINIR